MGIKDWNAGIIRPVPVAPTGQYQDSVASGVWTLEQAAYWRKQGLWPIANNLSPTAYWAGGSVSGPGRVNVIQYISITSLGNTSDFGDLTTARSEAAGCASSTRGIIAGGYNVGGNRQSSIEFITISTSGSSSSFGNLISGSNEHTGLSNSTRGVFGGGQNEADGTTNVISYITIASEGGATDFGDLSSKRYGQFGCASTTRGLFAGGATQVGGNQYSVTAIQYVTIATTGNASTFGDLSLGRNRGDGFSSSTRGVFLGGQSGNSVDEVSNMVTGSRIDYVTIATAGNATFFGSLTQDSQKGAASCSEIRGLVSVSGTANVINYITIATTGNALDFGDLLNSPEEPAGFSNAHGGL
jgi:hypothetical protein